MPAIKSAEFKKNKTELYVNRGIAGISTLPVGRVLRDELLIYNTDSN